jgi:hypothetical protein
MEGDPKGVRAVYASYTGEAERTTAHTVPRLVGDIRRLDSNFVVRLDGHHGCSCILLHFKEDRFMTFRWTHLAVGFAFDLFDWLIVGLTPILGDLVDILAAVYFYRAVGLIAVSGLIELIPGVDVLPTWTAIGLYASMKGGGGE